MGSRLWIESILVYFQTQPSSTNRTAEGHWEFCSLALYIIPGRDFMSFIHSFNIRQVLICFHVNKKTRGWLLFQSVVTLLNNLTQEKPLCYLKNDLIGHHLWRVWMDVTLSLSFPSTMEQACKKWRRTEELFPPRLLCALFSVGSPQGVTEKLLWVSSWLWTCISLFIICFWFFRLAQTKVFLIPGFHSVSWRKNWHRALPPRKHII